ncbi:MAG: alkaline phosphatase [Pseudonocardiaceae bacterium]
MARRTRTVFSALALSALASSLVVASATPALAQIPSIPPIPGVGPPAKNIILLIGDGMGQTHVDATRIRYYGAAGRLNMERMPSLGSVKTFAVEEGSDMPDLVTDSASAGTAWSSGVKTYNNALGKDSRGNVVPTIMEQAKSAGLRTGNVTNSEITDATPAAMFSHVSARGCQGPRFTQAACVRPSGQGANDVVIAEQIARNNTADVILGGGLSRFEPDDQAVMQSNGYTVLGSFGDPALPTQTAASQRVATQTDLAGVSGRDRKVIGLFNRGNMTVETFKEGNPSSPQAQEPSLVEMTNKAIDLLSTSRGARNGFFLQVEGALIDKRSHANDAAQTLRENKEFDDAVAAAVTFAQRDRQTLVIVTADHECAGFNIISAGSFTNAEATTPPGNVDSSNTANNSTPSRPTQGTRSPARSTGPINGSGSGDPNNFAPATFRTADDPAGVVDGSPDASLWLSYLSGNHTGADVPIYAFGPRSADFDEAIDNTDIFRLMRSALRNLRS